MSDIRLSVIIPACNEADCIDALLSDIRGQSGAPAFEIIVADGGSADATREIASAHGARLVEGGTASAGRNNGAHSALAETLLFLDADTRLDPGFLRDSYDEFVQRRLDVAAMDNIPIAPKSSLTYRAIYCVHNTFIRLVADFDPHMTSTCFLARRSTYASLGGFDESVAVFGDSEFAKRARKAGHKFSILESVSIRASVRRFEDKGPVRWAATVGFALIRRRLLGEATEGDFYWGAPR